MSEYDAISGNQHEAQRGLTNRFAGEKEAFSSAALNEVTTQLVNCGPGEFITLYWIAFSSSQENTKEVFVYVELSPWTPYSWYLGNPGAFMHWEPVVGAPGAPLIVGITDATQKVAVSVTYTISPVGSP